MKSSKKWRTSSCGKTPQWRRTRSGRLCLTAVIDLADRKAVGWAFRGGMDSGRAAVAALSMAFKNRPDREGLLFHSDRGTRYCAEVFRDTLAALCPSVRQSMSRNGNCWDNACAESFFKTLKREPETLDGRHAQADAGQSAFMAPAPYAH